MTLWQRASTITLNTTIQRPRRCSSTSRSSPPSSTRSRTVPTMSPTPWAHLLPCTPPTATATSTRARRTWVTTCTGSSPLVALVSSSAWAPTATRSWKPSVSSLSQSPRAAATASSSAPPSSSSTARPKAGPFRPLIARSALLSALVFSRVRRASTNGFSSSVSLAGWLPSRLLGSQQRPWLDLLLIRTRAFTAPLINMERKT
mmetsp:Transcript_17954/g.26971  ORF Transcript_17954/g.26971 Transcript_17954/m.26971 type:complete len:203 (-) Transcript_17954:187-795(-)